MSSEELAPTSLKKRRIERQEKYFKEQVLMKEDAKIISKTHKGENILTVNKDSNEHEDYCIPEKVSDNRLNKENSKNVSDNRWDDKSEKASWNYDSDEGEKKNISVIKNYSLSENMRDVSVTKLSSSKSKSELNLKNNSRKINENKYKNLSTDMMNFYNLLQEYTKENLLLKFNDKLKSSLKYETFQEIIKFREEEKSNLN